MTLKKSLALLTGCQQHGITLEHLDQRKIEYLITLERSPSEDCWGEYSWRDASLGPCQCNTAAEVDEEIEQGLHFTSLTEHKWLGTSIHLPVTNSMLEKNVHICVYMYMSVILLKTGQNCDIEGKN